MQIRSKSQKSAAVFGLNCVLPKDAITILRGLGEEKPQAMVAKEGVFKKQKVNYWTKAYLERGLIQEKSIGKPKVYTLTAVGTAILTRSDKTYPQPCIMEDYPVKFDLVRDNSSFDWVKLGDPRNWEKMGIHIGNVRVEKTSRSIIVHSGQLSGFNEYGLLLEAGGIHALVRLFCWIMVLSWGIMVFLFMLSLSLGFTIGLLTCLIRFMELWKQGRDRLIIRLLTGFLM